MKQKRWLKVMPQSLCRANRKAVSNFPWGTGREASIGLETRFSSQAGTLLAIAHSHSAFAGR